MTLSKVLVRFLAKRGAKTSFSGPNCEYKAHTNWLASNTTRKTLDRLL